MPWVSNLVGFAAATAVAGWISSGSIALAYPLSLFEPERSLGSIFDYLNVVRAPGGNLTEGVVLPAHRRRQIIEYQTREALGTIIIDGEYIWM